MKDKIKYYLLLLAFLFIMALILWFFHDWIEQYSNSLMVLITFITYNNKSLSFSKNIFGRSRPILFGLPK